MEDNNKITIAQIGLGRWGKNLLRNFSALPECFLKYACDMDLSMIKKLAIEYLDIKFISDSAEILNDKMVKAIVVATPAPTHYEVARKCLESGRHVFIEKPITLDVTEAQELVALAKKQNKKLMVGHLLLYHPAITKLNELIEAGELGDLKYIYTQRLNLGTVREAENAMWSLAPHDISIVLRLFNKLPVAVAANGADIIQKNIEDVVFLDLRFVSGEIANIHVSWLDPTKTRKTIVVGSKKMAVFDESQNKLFIMDKGVDAGLKLRTGNEVVEDYTGCNPLQSECSHFIDCVRNDKDPISDGENGLNVLRVLAAAERSLKNGGLNELL
jgi:predicted dehydrogenase